MNKVDISYKRIFKSTTLIASSQSLSYILGLLKFKAAAIFLGAGGVGVVGILNSLIAFSASAAALGVPQSTVRYVSAEESLSEDNKNKAMSFSVLFCFLSSVIICLLAATCYKFFDFNLAKEISYLQFLGAIFAVIPACISIALNALFQANKDIKNMAKTTVIGSSLGSVVAILVFYFGGFEYIWLALLISYSSLLFSQIAFLPVKKIISFMGSHEFLSSFKLRLPIAIPIFVSSILALSIDFFIKLYVANSIDIQSAGYYQAAWALSMMLISFILRAMSGDYYPQLCSIQSDNDNFNKLIGRQTNAAVFFSIPGVAILAYFPEYILTFFYSAEFSGSSELLTIFAVSAFIKVLSWPLGYAQLAKGRPKVFLLTEIFAFLVQILGFFIFFETFGLKGAAISFLFSLFAYWLLMLVVAHKISGFIYQPKSVFFVVCAFGLLSVPLIL